MFLLPRAAHSAQIEREWGAATATLTGKPALRLLAATYLTGSCYITACVCLITIGHGGNFKSIFETSTFKLVNFYLLTTIYAHLSIFCYFIVNIYSITSGTEVILNVYLKRLFLSLWIFFLPSGRKAPTFWPLRETKLPLSGAVELKNSIQTMASKKESLRHMFVNLGFASADNYMWSETFLILLALCRNIVLPFYLYCLHLYLCSSSCLLFLPRTYAQLPQARR